MFQIIRVHPKTLSLSTPSPLTSPSFPFLTCTSYYYLPELHLQTVMQLQLYMQSFTRIAPIHSWPFFFFILLLFFLLTFLRSLSIAVAFLRLLLFFFFFCFFRHLFITPTLQAQCGVIFLRETLQAHIDCYLQLHNILCMY